MYFTSLKIIIFMWQCGLVDTFTAVSFIYNTGAQYSAIVIAAYQLSVTCRLDLVISSRNTLLSLINFLFLNKASYSFLLNCI